MEISVELFDKICRICLLQATELKSLFTNVNDKDRNLLEILTFTANIDIKIRDSLPKQICSACESILYKADEFKRRCHESETILNNAFRNATTGVEISKFPQNFSIKVETTDLKQKLSEYGTIVSPISTKSNIKDGIDTKIVLPIDYAIGSAADLSFSKLCLSELPDKDTQPVNDEVLSNIEEGSNFLDHFDSGSQCEDVPLETIEDIKEEGKREKRKKEGKIGILYQCYCRLQFLSKDKYNSHLNENNCNGYKLIKSNMDVIKNKIQCTKCDRQFNSINGWKTHKIRTHNDYSPHQPNDCNENTNPKENGELFQCSYCSRRFKYKKSLSAHIERHENKDSVKHVCEICKREFKYKSYLENHVIAAHSRTNGLTCDICMKSFLNKVALETHKKSHETEKSHHCSVCNKGFYMSCTLKEHMRTHTGEKPYLCSLCGKSFSQKTNLAQHMRRHQGLKPYNCGSCEKRFVSKGELDAHMRKHSGAHPFVCDECGNGFTTSSALVKHRRVHTGERPYQCDVCSRRFAASGTLKNHRRTHTGERPFQCSYCEKAFVQRNDLISHIRCHTGEKPYICTQCGQSFRKASGLKAHLKIHIKDPVIGVNALLTSLHCREH